MIRVLVCDDHLIVRQGIKQILADAPDIAVAGEAANGQPGARDSTAVHIGSAWLGDRIGDFNVATGRGAVRIETDLWSRTYGDDGEPTSTLRVSAFELMRGSTGRRSQAQLDGWEWIGPARNELVVMPIFAPRADDFDG